MLFDFIQEEIDNRVACFSQLFLEKFAASLFEGKAVYISSYDIKFLFLILTFLELAYNLA